MYQRLIRLLPIEKRVLSTFGTVHFCLFAFRLVRVYADNMTPAPIVNLPYDITEVSAEEDKLIKKCLTGAVMCCFCDIVVADGFVDNIVKNLKKSCVKYIENN